MKERTMKKHNRLIVPMGERHKWDADKEIRRVERLHISNSAWWKKQMEIYNGTNEQGLPLAREDKDENSN